MIEVQPPNQVDGHYNSWPKVFLGGSIEMDTAERWQDRVKAACLNESVVFFNPRRDDWDSSIKQSMSDPRFSEQVNWELDNLIYTCDIAAFYFDPNTKSPITLMELGYIAGMGNSRPLTIVCCPQGFWRRGNVEIICDRATIGLVDNFDDFITYIRALAKHHGLPPSADSTR